MRLYYFETICNWPAHTIDPDGTAGTTWGLLIDLNGLRGLHCITLTIASFLVSVWDANHMLLAPSGSHCSTTGEILETIDSSYLHSISRCRYYFV